MGHGGWVFGCVIPPPLPLPPLPSLPTADRRPPRAQIPDKPEALLSCCDSIQICITREEIVEAKAAASNLRFVHLTPTQHLYSLFKPYSNPSHILFKPILTLS